MQKKKRKILFSKISAGNHFGQLRISYGLIFGQKKIRNFVSPKFLGFNVSSFCDGWAPRAEWQLWEEIDQNF